jgi:transcription initiation factor TFIID subunit TAF12
MPVTFDPLMSYLLIALFLYILYRFVTGFIIPVARTTSQVKQQFRTMKEQMEQAQQQYQQQNAQQPQQTSKPGAMGKYDIEGEYIPFEDVK